MNDELDDSGAAHERHVIDFILGITFDIWEGRQVESIADCYAPDVEVFGLDDVTLGVPAVIAGTQATLEAFPDRRLFGDAVIWSRQAGAAYSSHRIISPMTHLGDTRYARATGRAVRIMNIADCIVENGRITREWLMRDHHALCIQLGIQVLPAARIMAQQRSDAGKHWLVGEHRRLEALGKGGLPGDAGRDAGANGRFAAGVFETCWRSGDAAALELAYAPYSVLHRSPIDTRSGRDAICEHYAALRRAFRARCIAIDHFIEQPGAHGTCEVALRWTVLTEQIGEFLGLEPQGREAVILGATHWRLLEGRIIAEWTVFDGVGVLSQLI